MKLAYTDDDWERAEYDYRCKKEERRVMDNSVEIYEAFAGGSARGRRAAN